MKKVLLIAIILAILAGAGYYWFFYRNNTPQNTQSTSSINQQGFNPLNPSGGTINQEPINQNTQGNQVDYSSDTNPTKIPTLRHLSSEPIGGYFASTTASSTVVRYVDRGTGHIYETTMDSPDINKISNTTISKVYESYWNKDLTAMIIRYIKSGTDTITNFYAEIRPSTEDQNSTSTTPFEIKGKFLSPYISSLAVSPKRDKIFTFNIENGKGIGYISGFDESKKTKIVTMPFTMAIAEWPEDNSVTITTKASGVSSGFMYLLDTKKGSYKKIIGGIQGLTTKTSPDGKYVLFSKGGSEKNLGTYTFNIKDGTTDEVIFGTISDKCVWSKENADEVYCAVPTDIPQGIYPDDWYKGKVSFSDKIWFLNVSTGQVKQVANLLNLSNELIDVTDISLDPKENFLFFVNKKDLTLWSLDLND